MKKVVEVYTIADWHKLIHFNKGDLYIAFNMYKDYPDHLKTEIKKIRITIEEVQSEEVKG
jgi:hypothetical protein